MKKLCELPLGIYEKAICNSLSWEEKLLLARDSGFDFIELSIDGTPERLERLYDGGFAVKVRAAAAAVGLPVYTMALTANRAFPLGSEDKTVRSRGLELVRRALALAEETGIELVHLAGYDQLGDKRNDNTKKLFYDAVEHIALLAEGSPVKLAVETMDADFMGSCTDIVKLCREQGRDKLRCYADVGNLSANGLDMPAELLAGGAYIAGLHLKDARPGVCRDIPFGEGMVDFKAAFGALEAIGYQGFMTAEAWSYDKESYHPYLKRISSFLRGELAEYEKRKGESR